MSNEHEKILVVLAGLRDWLQSAEKLREDIDTVLNEAAQQADIEKPWNPAAISWEPRESSKGPYEMAEGAKQKTHVDYDNLKAELNRHSGFLQRDGYKYWSFTNADAVGRRKA